MRNLFLIAGVIACSAISRAQNPSTTFTIPQRTITLPCGTTCTSFNVQLPHIKQTTDYVITRPAYVPFAYTTPNGIDVTTLISSSFFDDQWTSKVPITFPFCFYGITYPTLIIGTNSAISFDTTRASTNSGYTIGTTGQIPNTAYAPSMIFGPYHDINIDEPGTNKRIEYRIEGVAPNRRFVTSYSNIPYFDLGGCTSLRATHQMVLYESTGIIEVYIKDKPSCTEWNGGRTILGIQNQARNMASAVPGKNATVWGNNAMDSAWRFIPSGGASRFKSAQLVVNGNVVATGDTSTTGAGELNLAFNNICPTADSTAYVIRATFGLCNDPSQDVVLTDTVFVKKSTPVVNIQKTDANCQGNGSITVNVTGGIAPLEYSINNGPYQTGNVFNNVAPGNYTVNIRDNAQCVVSQQVSIVLQNNLQVSAGADTTICTGASFTRTATGNAASYSWTPSAGVSNTSIAGPVFNPQTTTQYTVTGTTGNCTATSRFTVNVVPGASINAGPDANIFSGQSYTMQASGSGGTYVWTPSTGLSSANILNPVATPQTTTTYTLTVTTQQGCTASDAVTINVVPYCIKPMEAFTPNGDGINERWLITNGDCLRVATAQVFNRYGAKVFESKDYRNTWDGTYNGKPLPDGTYYYVIDYTLLNGQREIRKGSLTILR